jgi:hypothetical protein
MHAAIAIALTPAPTVRVVHRAGVVAVDDINGVASSSFIVVLTGGGGDEARARGRDCA